MAEEKSPADPMPAPVPDPRDRVTEQAFRVDASLLGLPLAGPVRRLVALLLDLGAASALSALGPVLLVGIGLFLLVRGVRTEVTERWSRLLRWSLVAAGGLALTIFGIVFVVSNIVSELDLEALKAEARELEATSTSTTTPLELERRIAQRVVELLPEGEERTELERALARVPTSSAALPPPRAPREAIDRFPSIVRLGPDSRRGDDDWSAQTLFVQLLGTFGLTFGWIGAYFTISLVLGRGQTPAKRLLGLRVVRLDGRAIGFWAAFERFSGLGAGLATGLLGFAQIYWDDNRQAIHDKISNTVVIRTGRPRLDPSPNKLGARKRDA